MKCCFCSKEITKNTAHNPEPLSEDFDSVCCGECNINYVSPVRKLLWRPWVGQRNTKRILAGLRRLPLENLRDVLKDVDDIHDGKAFEDWLSSAKKDGVVR